jgi:hypothetical protein
MLSLADDEEREIFSTFDYAKVHCGIVRHPSLPQCNRVDNTPFAATPGNYTEFPEMPFVGRFDCMAHGSDEEVDIVAWKDHGFQHWHVSAEDTGMGSFKKFPITKGHCRYSSLNLISLLISLHTQMVRKT